MARRDFTVNAIARRLETNELLDPLHGRDDLERSVLRTTSPTSFRDDPLRIVRGLRFVSQLGVDPDEETLAQMREWAPPDRARLGRADRRRARRRRHGRALEAPARRPARRRRCGSRATPACSCTCCPSSSPRSGSTRRAATTTCRSTSTSSASSRRPPTRARRCRSGSRRCCTTSASRSRPGAARTAACTSTRTPRSASEATRRSAPTWPRRR